MKILKDGNNIISQNEIIFTEGQNAQSMGLLLKGNVDVFLSLEDSPSEADQQQTMKNSFRLFTIKNNIFLGINDLYMSSNYSYCYRAAEETYLHVFLMENHGNLRQVMKSKKEYASYFVTSLSYLIDKSFSAYNSLNNLSQFLGTITHNLSVLYLDLSEKMNIECKPSSSFCENASKDYAIMSQGKKQFPTSFSKEFIERDHMDFMDDELFSVVDLDEIKVKYYAQLQNLSSELRRDFFGSEDFVVGYHCYDASKCLQDLQSGLKACFNAAAEFYKRIYSQKEACLLSEYAKLLEKSGSNPEEREHLLQILNYIIDKINETNKIFEEQYAYTVGIDEEYLSKISERLLEISGQISQRNANSDSISASNDQIPNELVGSLEKILTYSGISAERAALLRNGLNLFRKMEDKSIFSQVHPSEKNSVTNVFFEVYEAVFKRVKQEKNSDCLYQLFLNYGYMDEKLLKNEQVISLYKQEVKDSENKIASIYSMQGWLDKIVNMERDPSVNEFQEDYFDTFRSMKKRGEVTDTDKPAYDANREKRLNFEIMNMFKTNHKLCNGRITTYFPILHKEMITCDISRAFLNAERVCASLSAILKVDFSAFYREIFYLNPKQGIEKHTIMKNVIPDIVLVPIFGSKPILWQEISGRNRSTPARLLLPILTDVNLDDMMVTLVGNFRWELCRTMMGVSWMDITQKSLTSEYTDYLQFFHKNSDLHMDVKAKIKVQIQKYHNKARDIFTSDYRAWIENEGNYSMRLNKVVRGILFRYCPYSSEIRNNFENHPGFNDLITRFKNEREKKVKSLESQYRQLTQNGGPLDSDLVENLNFYKNL